MPLPLLLYLQNTGLWVPLDAYVLGPGISLNHMWSLAVEEQFYLFWPVIVFLVRDLRKLMWIALGISGGALLLRLSSGCNGGFALVFVLPHAVPRGLAPARRRAGARFAQQYLRL